MLQRLRLSGIHPWNLSLSEHFPKGKIDASGASQRMLPITERRYAVIDEACGTAPHHDISAFEAKAAHAIGATFAAPHKYSRQTE